MKNIPFKISQSLIKECLKQDHCPKQIYYSFVEGKDLLDKESQTLYSGRYFESELIGACRGGKKEPPKLKNNGEKYAFVVNVDETINFAKEVFKRIGLDVSKGESQIDVESETLKGAIDHRNLDIQNPNKKANYDVKWTGTQENDIWNGWGDPDTKEDAKIQATHYTLLSYEETGKWMPFYFLVFGVSKWVKVLRFNITQDAIKAHKAKISHTAALIRDYADKNYKGNGSYNKCLSCPFYDECPDKSNKPQIQIITV